MTPVALYCECGEGVERVSITQRLVTLHGQPLALTPIEYDLLKLFISSRGKLLTRQMLVHEVWGQEEGRQHSLHVYVARLCQKIEPVPECPRFILTVPGVGYRFQEVHEDDASPPS